MNQSKAFASLLLFFFIQVFSQQNELNYPTELPFQTQNDSEYYHLESSLLIRTIVKDIIQVLEKSRANKQSQHFIINFKNSKGAEFPIDYAVSSDKLDLIFSSDMTKGIFMAETYDWINRSFRTNIPF